MEVPPIGQLVLLPCPREFAEVHESLAVTWFLLGIYLCRRFHGLLSAHLSPGKASGQKCILESLCSAKLKKAHTSAGVVLNCVAVGWEVRHSPSGTPVESSFIGLI